MPLRAADITATRKFEDGDDFIELRLELTKSEEDEIRDLTTGYKLDPTGQNGGMVEVEARTAIANKHLFRKLCVAWSLPGEPTVQAYESLDTESGEWVDECISQVLAERRARAEKKPSSSAKPKPRGTSSARAAGSKKTAGQ